MLVFSGLSYQWFEFISHNIMTKMCTMLVQWFELSGLVHFTLWLSGLIYHAEFIEFISHMAKMCTMLVFSGLIYHEEIPIMW